MEMPVNTFKRALVDGRPQIGLWSSLCTNWAAEVLAPAGFDWILIDMEHSPNEISSVLGQLQVYESVSTMPVVRPAWNDPVLIKRVLDLGVYNLLLPMVQTPDDAEAAVRATRYPPLGIRGVSLNQRGNRFGRIKDYVDPLDETVSAVAWGADVEVGTWRAGVHVQAALVGGDNWESLDVADQPARFVAFQTMVSYYHPLRGDKIVGVEPAPS